MLVKLLWWIKISRILLKQQKDLDKPEYTIVTKLGVTGEIAKKILQKSKNQLLKQKLMLLLRFLNGKAKLQWFMINLIMYYLWVIKEKDKLVHLDTPLTYEPLGGLLEKASWFLNWLNNFKTISRRSCWIQWWIISKMVSWNWLVTKSSIIDGKKASIIGHKIKM